MVLQTEFDFVLPRGYIDESGTLHKEGAMRIATVKDEISPLNDPRVRNNEAYLVVLLLSRVIIRLGALTTITPDMVENFFATDIAFLQNLYQQINEMAGEVVATQCPHCGHEFDVDVSL